MEHCCSMHRIDKIPVEKIAKQIETVGVESIVFSSDVGQAFSPAPGEALADILESLVNMGLSLHDVECMCCKNPQKLVAA